MTVRCPTAPPRKRKHSVKKFLKNIFKRYDIHVISDEDMDKLKYDITENGSSYPHLMIIRSDNMKNYIGTEVVQAKPMTRGDYNLYRGWTIPENENPDDPGYLVKYSDDYESWSPAAQFERAYRDFDGDMNFGHAIELMKMGFKVARNGWNGKKQHIELASNISYTTTDGEVVNVNHEATGNRAIAFVGTSGVQMGWLASQADMLANDWKVV